MSKQKPRPKSLITVPGATVEPKEVTKAIPKAPPPSRFIKPVPVAVSHGFPTPEHPCYHLRLAFSLEGSDSYQIRRVKVNGQRVRDFEPFRDFRFVKNQILKPEGIIFGGSKY